MDTWPAMSARTLTLYGHLRGSCSRRFVCTTTVAPVAQGVEKRCDRKADAQEGSRGWIG
jgi:hypothetical protein